MNSKPTAPRVVAACPAFVTRSAWATCAGFAPDRTNARSRSRSARASASPMVGYSPKVIMLAWPLCRYRPVGLPHYGGVIERLIGTFMRRMEVLPGTTKSNVVEKGEYDATGKAAMTLAQLRKWMAAQVAAYHATEHRMLRKPPACMWIEPSQASLPDARADVPPLSVAGLFRVRCSSWRLWLPTVWRRRPVSVHPGSSWASLRCIPVPRFRSQCVHAATSGTSAR